MTKKEQNELLTYIAAAFFVGTAFGGIFMAIIYYLEGIPM